LLSSLDVAKYLIRPAAPGTLNPGHGITYRPLILYGRGKEADVAAEGSILFSVIVNRPTKHKCCL